MKNSLALLVLFSSLIFSFNANGADFCQKVINVLTGKISHPKTSVNEQLKTGRIDTFTAYSREAEGQTIWSNQRAKLHESILKRFNQQVMLAHQVLVSSPFVKKQTRPQPLLILTRGNSGSGKTYAVKHSKHSLIQSLHLSKVATNHELGVINPDSIKSVLQNEVHQGQVSSSTVHEEGSYLAKVLLSKAFQQGTSFIIDKRFTTPKTLESVLEQSQKYGYRVIMIDVDAALSDSSLRIVGRPIGGESPNVPFEAIRSGFIETRKHRYEIANSPSIDDYILLTGKDLVAHKSPQRGLVIEDQVLWQELTENNVSEIEKSDALYRDILNSLSQVTVEDVLKPFVKAKIKSRDDLMLEDYGTLMQLRDLHYLLQKGEGLEYHRRFSSLLIKYVSRQFPEMEFNQKITPESSSRMPSITITFKTKNRDHANILLLTSLLEFKANSSKDGLHIVELDTRKISLIRPDQLHEREEDLSKYQINGAGQKSGGETAYDFIKNSVALNIDAVRLFNISIEAKGVKIRFNRDRDFIQFRYGFSTVEIQANIFAAQVEHYLYKTASGADKLSHSESAKSHLMAAKEFMAAFEWAQSEGSSNTLISSPQTYTAIELQEWLGSLKKTIQALETQLILK